MIWQGDRAWIWVAGAGTALLLVLGVASCRSPAWKAWPHTILFVVLDTVRSQNMSICGYERPTTPTLELFVQGRAAWTCGGVAPSTWTLPSHASFFTGLEQPRHGAGIGPGTVEFPWGTASGLGPEHPTLAERFAARGYQTVLVSGNPFVSELAGLTRGFDVARVADSFPRYFDDGLVEVLGETLEGQVETGEPLFLFVNISDAHNPWNDVPDVGWLPPRPGASGIVERKLYEGGEMSPDDAELLLAHVRDVYDYGVFRADRTLGRVLELLEHGAFFDETYRIVVTSDHGEYLGEHGRLLHGGPQLFEEVLRVPVLYKDSVAEVELPPTLSATAVYELTLDGRLPEGLPARATTFSQRYVPEPTGDAPCWKTTSALWAPAGKLVCEMGEVTRFDLAADPREASPLDPGGHPRLAEFLRFARETEATGQEVDEVDEEITRKLKALGYLE